MTAHPHAFTTATLATALRDLEAVRDAIKVRAGTIRDPRGELIPVLGRTCMAIETIERAIQQLEEETATP